MHRFELIAPCHFGLEAVLKKEIYDLGYEITKVEDGKVTFAGDEEAICRANLFLRTAERVLLKVGEFQAETFDALFEGTKALPWEAYIPEDGKFWVAKATSIKSKLFSPSDIQSIMKKAIVERMKQQYHRSWFSEEGSAYPLRVTIMKDVVTIGLDTSGNSLHKRGYRLSTGKAPITETLAAALILLTPWNRDRILVDPFCGSGTFAIEAALMGMKIPPGMYRTFLAMDWKNLISAKEWKETLEEAEDGICREVKMEIQGYDIDGEMIQVARENAKRAKVAEQIHFQQRSVSELRHSKKYGFIITNPPYGERIGTQESIREIYTEFGRQFRALDSWSAYVITASEHAEQYFGRKADKNRKIYNGMMRTYFYQFLGPKPPQGKKNMESR
ncbi:MAG: class I SAM-dependent RNA methyltransferase [Lachnospiraceae bacterium]|nr:class I SAM-dependent RNA methyltransferase [Lachnospiraceae bacterium]